MQKQKNQSIFLSDSAIRVVGAVGKKGSKNGFEGWLAISHNDRTAIRSRRDEYCV